MEGSNLWIVVGLCVVVLMVLSVVVYVLRCCNYSQAFKKMRTLSMSPAASHTAHAHPESGNGRPGSRDNGAAAQRTGSDQLVAVRVSGDVEMYGGAFPMELVVIPPPYCEHPPAYEEVAPVHYPRATGMGADPPPYQA